MTRLNIQKYQMLARVADFGLKHVGLFPKGTVAAELLSAIVSAVEKLAIDAGSHVANNAAIRVTSKTRQSARKALRAQLELIYHTARALRFEYFEAPGSSTDQGMINSGRAYTTAAEPLKQQFVEQGLPPEFIESLNSAIHDLEGAILRQVASKASRAGSIREFNKTLNQTLGDFQRFEVLVANTMSSNPAVMAAWDAARRIERTGGGKPPTPPTPLPAVAPANAAAVTA